jgi:hypothetical protein
MKNLKTALQYNVKFEDSTPVQWKILNYFQYVFNKITYVQTGGY